MHHLLALLLIGHLLTTMLRFLCVTPPSLFNKKTHCVGLRLLALTLTCRQKGFLLRCAFLLAPMLTFTFVTCHSYLHCSWHMTHYSNSMYGSHVTFLNAIVNVFMIVTTNAIITIPVIIMFVGSSLSPLLFSSTCYHYHNLIYLYSLHSSLCWTHTMYYFTHHLPSSCIIVSIRPFCKFSVLL